MTNKIDVVTKEAEETDITVSYGKPSMEAYLKPKFDRINLQIPPKICGGEKYEKYTFMFSFSENGTKLYFQKE